MAVYSNGIETKQNFILAAYDQLRTADVSQLTVRELTGRLGYSPASLYRHFKSLEYLIVVASVRFLDTYFSEFCALVDGEEEIFLCYLNGWRLFNKHAFARPDIYYRLFWGEYNNQFCNAIQEYFELFPLSQSQHFPYLYSLFFSNNIQQRDYMVLQQAARQNLLTEEEALYFSRTNSLIAKGTLLEAISANPEKRRQCEAECNQLIAQNLSRANTLYQLCINRSGQ